MKWLNNMLSLLFVQVIIMLPAHVNLVLLSATVRSCTMLYSLLVTHASHVRLR